ncbi:unnamed protein product [Protopolystoma xenopodis]|uniref:Uncharacterized protein n=1 Tax=Protopolystoma xenopodis TaxID=117903 RepID=A0A448XQ77_9PLAT|nr:unnamed protein product [Protopolystoma xenopodis]
MNALFQEQPLKASSRPVNQALGSRFSSKMAKHDLPQVSEWVQLADAEATVCAFCCWLSSTPPTSTFRRNDASDDKSDILYDDCARGSGIPPCAVAMVLLMQYYSSVR